MGFFSDSFSLSFSLLHRFTRHGESAMKCELFLAAALLVATFVAVPVEDDDEVELDDDECDCSKYTWDFCQKLEKEFLANKKLAAGSPKSHFQIAVKLAVMAYKRDHVVVCALLAMAMLTVKVSLSKQNPATWVPAPW